MSTTTTEDTPTTGQKFAAEVFGTFGLVFFGCGTAMLTSEAGAFDYVGTALAFGLAVLVMAYAVGRISGGHFNPAVTLGAALGGRLAWREVGVYVGAQLLGGLLAGAVLFGLFHGIEGFDAEGNMAQNSFGDDGSGYAWWAALLLELLLTAIFVWVVLAVTDARNALNAASAPLAIGLALTMIHLASIGFTGTSVNPARSIGVAVFAGTDAIVQLWLFILAPLLGAAIAGITYPLIFAHGDEPVQGSGLRLGEGASSSSCSTPAPSSGASSSGPSPAPRSSGASPARRSSGASRPLPRRRSSSGASRPRPPRRRSSRPTRPAATPSSPRPSSSRVSSGASRRPASGAPRTRTRTAAPRSGPRTESAGPYGTVVSAAAVPGAVSCTSPTPSA